MVKNLPASARDAGGVGLIPGSERPSGEANGSLLQCSRLGSLTDRGALQAAVPGVSKELDVT